MTQEITEKCVTYNIIAAVESAVSGPFVTFTRSDVRQSLTDRWPTFPESWWSMREMRMVAGWCQMIT